MAYKHAKLTLKDLPVREALARIRFMVERLEQHPGYTKARSRIAEARELLDATTQAADEAEHFRSLARAAIAKRNASFKKLCGNARFLVSDVQSVSKGDPAAILSAGLHPVAEKTSVGKAPAPEQPRARPGTHAGTIDFRWKSLRQRCLYVVHMTTNPDDAASWRQADMVYKAKCLAKRLTPGKLYWLRVKAINWHGHGPWSQPVSARAA
jgi:hypothetical protein